MNKPETDLAASLPAARVLLRTAVLPLAAALGIFAWPVAAVAADTTPVDRLANARGAIGASRWQDCLSELRRGPEPGNADWHNLMGYCLRKQAKPDLAGAERSYEAALRINPLHRGALEYIGELHLMQQQPERAEARLATLQQACPQGCEELEDLKAAVARYRAGKR